MNIFRVMVQFLVMFLVMAMVVMSWSMTIGHGVCCVWKYLGSDSVSKVSVSTASARVSKELPRAAKIEARQGDLFVITMYKQLTVSPIFIKDMR